MRIIIPNKDPQARVKTIEISCDVSTTVSVFIKFSSETDWMTANISVKSLVDALMGLGFVAYIKAAIEGVR